MLPRRARLTVEHVTRPRLKEDLPHTTTLALVEPEMPAAAPSGATVQDDRISAQRFQLGQELSLLKADCAIEARVSAHRALSPPLGSASRPTRPRGLPLRGRRLASRQFPDHLHHSPGESVEGSFALIVRS